MAAIVDIAQRLEALTSRARHGGRVALRGPLGRARGDLAAAFRLDAGGEAWLPPGAFPWGVRPGDRAAQVPAAREPAARQALGAPAIDPTPFQTGGLCWMAYSPTGPRD